MKVVKTEVRIKGVCEAARRLGCSKTHLSLLIRGKRDSKRLRERARELGIRIPRLPRSCHA